MLIYGNVDGAVRKCQYLARCVCVCEHLQHVHNILQHTSCCCDNTVLLLLGTCVAVMFMITDDEFIDWLFNMLFAVLVLGSNNKITVLIS